MDINIKDIVTLSDKNSYVVVSKTSYQEDTYYYLVDKSNNGNIKFCVENMENKSLLELDDANLIQQLLPIFLEASAKAITKEDLELLIQESEEK